MEHKFPQPHISVSAINKYGVIIDRQSSRRSRRIFDFIQRDKFSGCIFEVRVTYASGNMNAGIYKTRALAVQALKAFLEEK